MGNLDDAILDEIIAQRGSGVPPQSIPGTLAPSPPASAQRANPDDAILDEIIAQRDPNAATAARVQQALGDAEGKKPEDEARRAQLAEQLGTVPGLLPSIPEAEAELRRKQLPTQAADLAANSPKTANWSLVPGHTARAGTLGLTALAKLEESFPSIGYPATKLRSGLASASAGTAKLIDDLASSIYNHVYGGYEDLKAKHRADAGIPKLNPHDTFMGRLAKSEQDRSESLAARADIIDPSHKDKKYAVGWSDENAAYKDPMKMFGDALQSLPSTALLIAASVASRGAAVEARLTSLAESAAAGIAESVAAATATKAAIAAASKTMAIFQGIGEGVLSYAQNSLSTTSEVEKMAYDKIASSPTLQKYIKMGYGPDVAQELTAREAGQQSGIRGGALTGLIAFIGGKFTGKFIGEGGAFLPRFGKGAINEALVEAPQGGQEQWQTNLAIREHADKTRQPGEGVLEATVQGAVLGPIIGGPIAGFAGKHTQAQQAVTDRDTLNKLALDAAGNPVREHSPKPYRDFIDSLTEGRPVREVFIDTNILRDVFAQAGVTERELTTVFPEVAAQLADEANTEGFVSIKTSDLITGIKTPEILKSVLDNARVQTDGEMGMTFAEAEAFFQTQNEGLTRAQVKAAEVQAAAKQHAQDIAEIRQTITDELVATGRYDRTIAATNAVPITAFYEQRARDFNAGRAKEDFITAKQLFEQYPYKAQGEVEKIKYLAGTADAVTVAPGENSKVFTATATTESEPKIKQQLMQDEKGNYVWEKYQKDQAKKLTTPEGKVLTPATFKTEADLKAAIKANPLIVKRNLAGGKKGSFNQGGAATPSIPEQFYSQLRKVFRDAPEKIFTGGAQVKAWLASNHGKLGIKKEEIFWSGINEYLDITGKVSKADVLAFLDGNGAKVEVKMLGKEPTNAAEFKKREDELDDLRDRGGRISHDEWRRRMTELQKEFGYDENGKPLDKTKFAQYQLPGGTNYREMLITLPSKKVQQVDVMGREELSAWYEKEVGYSPIEEDPQISTDALRELVRAYDAENGAQTSPTVTSDFRSSHFDQPNIAAHIRMNDRVGANGEKILFIEEVQSDWGQKGKKEGFSKVADKSELDAMKEEMAALNRRAISGPNLNQAEYARLDELIRLTKAGVSSTANTPGVPSAPFVTDTKAWASLAMKHVIQQAVEGGYDSVAWTNGEQQFDRWGSEEIAWVKEGKGWRVSAKEQVGGNAGGVDLEGAARARGILNEETGKVVTSKEQLRSIVATVLARENNDTAIDKIADRTWERMQSEDAGTTMPRREGMKGYYDAILPQVVSGIFKQLKVEGKVESVEVRGGYARDSSGIPSRYKELTEQPAFTITPELAAKVTNEGMPFFQANNAEFNPATLMSTFYAGANLSSIIHESGHFYLEMMERLANRPDAPQKIKDDFNLYMEWFGIAPEQWAGMDNAARTPYHEQFALSQELWMIEGKSPTLNPKMESAFARFRQWMLSVYTSAAEFLRQHPSAGKLNDEVRAAFSRLIASEEAIREAEVVRGYVPLFQTAAEAGVSQEAFDEYMSLREEFIQKAISTAQKRSMRDLKWLSNAQSGALKKIQDQAEGLRSTIREEVAAEVMAEPINRARQAMLNGEVKMNIEELGAMVNSPAVAGMVAKDGMPLDVVAAQFGFPSSEVLLQELAHAENAQEKIAGLTDQRMLQEHGDMVDARAIEKAMYAAVQNEALTRFLATGLKLLSKSSLPISQITKAAKLKAQETISKIPLNKLRPAYYEAAERKALATALENAGKDPARAIAAQQAAILNRQLHKVATETQERIQAGVTRLNRITKPAAQKAMGGEHILQLNALVDRFGIRSKNTLLTEGTPRKSLAEYAATEQLRPLNAYLEGEAKRLSAIALNVPSWIADGSVSQDYNSLTVAQFDELMDSVKAIELLARREREQYAAFRGATFAEAKAKNLAVFRKNFPKLFLPNGQLKPTVTDPRHSVANSLGDTSDAVQAALSSSEAIVSILEGGKVGDLFYSLIWPMSSRNDWKVARMEEIFKAVQPLLDQYSPLEQIAFTRKDIGTEALGFVMTREAALTVTLYHGSKTGQDRLSNHTLTNGKRLDVATQQKVIDLLDARDIKLANGLWAVFDKTLWPELKALDERTKGKGAPKVEAMSHKAKNGDLTGGYYEIKYDTEESATPGNEASAVAEMMSGQASGRRVSTAQGTSIAREEHTKYRPRLDLGVFFETVNKVVNDLAYREVVADTQRMLLDPDIETVIKTAGSKVEYQTLQHRVGAMVMGAQLPSGPFEKAADLARKNTSVVLLSGIWTGLQNYTNLSAVADELGTANVAWETLRMHSPMAISAFRFGMKNSVFLRNYHLSFDRTVQENSKKLTSKQKFMPNMSTWLWFMGKINQIVASITWNAAYKKGMALNQNDHNVSVIYADNRTRKLVGSGRDADVTKIAEGHWLPLLNMMYSFFNSQLMILMEKSTLLKRTLKSDEETAAFKAKAVALYAKSWLMIVAIPAILGDMALGAFRGDPDKDDEDKLTHYLKAIGLYNISFIPGGGSVGAFLYRKGLDMDSYGLKISPVEAAITGVAAGAGSAIDIWNDEGDIKDVGNEIMALSYMLGLPGSFVKNAVVGGYAYANEQAGPEALLFGPPKVPR
jgi:hypothetical protein